MTIRVIYSAIIERALHGNLRLDQRSIFYKNIRSRIKNTTSPCRKTSYVLPSRVKSRSSLSKVAADFIKALRTTTFYLQPTFQNSPHRFLARDQGVFVPLMAHLRLFGFPSLAINLSYLYSMSSLPKLFMILRGRCHAVGENSSKSADTAFSRRLGKLAL